MNGFFFLGLTYTKLCSSAFICSLLPFSCKELFPIEILICMPLLKYLVLPFLMVGMVLGVSEWEWVFGGRQGIPIPVSKGCVWPFYSRIKPWPL